MCNFSLVFILLMCFVKYCLVNVFFLFFMSIKSHVLFVYLDMLYIYYLVKIIIDFIGAE